MFKFNFMYNKLSGLKIDAALVKGMVKKLGLVLNTKLQQAIAGFDNFTAPDLTPVIHNYDNRITEHSLVATPNYNGVDAETFESIKKHYKLGVKTIKSCRTIEHLNSAANFMAYFHKRFISDVSDISLCKEAEVYYSRMNEVYHAQVKLLRAGDAVEQYVKARQI